MADTVPALRATRAASSSASGWPTASIAASTPRPSVAALTAARGSSSVRCTGSAPKLAASSSRSGTRVDRDHLGGAGGLGRLDGAQADRAEAEHGHGVAGPHAGLVDRVPAGAHHVAGEQGGVVGHALGHAPQGQVGVRDEHLVGLGALERAERLAVAEHAALVALVEVAAAAEEALAAGRAVAAQHAVALGHLGHAVARRDHRAHELVAEREAGLDLHAPVVDVQVRAADAGGLHPHHRVVALEQLRLGPLLEPDLARCLECDRLHRPRGTL